MSAFLDEIKQRIIPVLRQHDVVRAAIFGSFARGEAKEDSDLDVLVELPRSKSLFDFVALKLDLEEALGRKVDVVEYSTLHPLVKDRILNEQVIIL